MSNLDAFQLVIYLDLLYFVLIHPRSLTENGISNRKYHWNNIYIAFSMPMWIVGVYRAGVSYRQLRYIEWISKATTPKRKKANAMCVLLQTVCICTTANELPRDAKSSRKKKETSNDITPTRTHTQTHSHGTDTHLSGVFSRPTIHSMLFFFVCCLLLPTWIILHCIGERKKVFAILKCNCGFWWISRFEFLAHILYRVPVNVYSNLMKENVYTKF